MRGRLDRRQLLAGSVGALSVLMLGNRAIAQAGRLAVDATFLFTNDIHACRTSSGYSPNCVDEGKTDENLRRQVKAINAIGGAIWPTMIDGKATGLASAGRPIGTPLGLVIGGDLTDDGGGQTALREEGAQLIQLADRYTAGEGADRLAIPSYFGLGNHDLDQDGAAGETDWYRRELRDFVESRHRSGVFFKPAVPVPNYDVDSDCYSWDWGGLHLVQCQRFAGDTNKGAISALPWLKADLAAHAGDGRPVIIFQHYGWDTFSTEAWDPAKTTFDDAGTGAPHWWSEAERTAMLAALKGYNVVGLFHGHEHPSALIYNRDGIDIFKPKAAFMGGFSVIRVTDNAMDVALCEVGADGTLAFTDAFTKTLS